jgi:hypothetical protein
VNLLSPWTALLAALVAVPLLLLLYVLKLRRRTLRLPSTLLWQRSFQDVQANVPFQRLRASWLLFVQIVLLALLAIALGEPVMQATKRPASRVILLIDRSASMSATDAGGDEPRTRLEAAKDAARDAIDRLARGGEATRIMIVSFGATTRVVQCFDSRRDVLLDALDTIDPSDEEGNLAAALQLAGVFASRAEITEGDEPPDVVLFSDGGVAPPTAPAGYALPAGRFRFVRVGPAPDEAVANAGFVSLSGRRDHNDPARVLVFARLLNAGPEAVETVVTLLVDDEPGPIRSVTIPPASDDGTGEATVTFAVELARRAVLGVRHGSRDALVADDTAAAVLPPPARPRIAIVHDGEGADPFLRDLLEGLEPASLRTLTPAALAAVDAGALDAGAEYDLIVFDRVAPQRLPGVPTITLGAVPAGVGAVEAAPGDKRILSWQRRHPVMRHVELDTIVYADFGGLDLPPGATALASGPEGPVIALLGARGAEHAVIGFELGRSNWALHVSVAVFLQNLVEHVTLARSGQVSRTVLPGEPVTVRSASDANVLRIVGPDGAQEVPRPAEAGPLVTLPAFSRVGLYAVEGAAAPDDRLAVSMLSDVESDLRPVESLLVNAEARRGGTGSAGVPRAIWPWFVAAAVAVLVMEWILYCRRFRT